MANLFLEGIGAIFKKATEWIPSKKESHLNKIDKLTRENAELQKQVPLSATAIDRIMLNTATIKRLREEADRIA